MFNIDFFHQQISEKIGQKLTVGDKIVNIKIDHEKNPLDPWILIEAQGTLLCVSFYASDNYQNTLWEKRISKDQEGFINAMGLREAINNIAETIHQVYIFANN